MISDFKDTAIKATQTETTEGKKKINDLWDSVNQKGRAISMFEKVMAESFANLKKKLYIHRFRKLNEARLGKTQRIHN